MISAGSFSDHDCTTNITNGSNVSHVMRVHIQIGFVSKISQEKGVYAAH